MADIGQLAAKIMRDGPGFTPGMMAMVADAQAYCALAAAYLDDIGAESIEADEPEIFFRGG